MIRDLRLPNTKTPRCVSSLRRRWAYPHIFDIFSCSLLYSFISGHATMLSGGGPPGAAGLTRRRLSFSWAVALWQLVGTYLNKRGGWTISILVPSNKYLEGKRYLVGSFFLSDPNLLASLETMAVNCGGFAGHESLGYHFQYPKLGKGVCFEIRQELQLSRTPSFMSWSSRTAHVTGIFDCQTICRRFNVNIRNLV